MKLPSLRTILGYRLFHPVFAIPAFGFLLIGCIWLVVLRQLAVDKESAIARALADLQSVAVQYEQETLRTIKSGDRWALRIKYEFEASGTVEPQEIMGSNSLLPEEISRISIADSSGSIIANSRDTKPFNIADRDYFQHHAVADTGKLDISVPIFSRVSGDSTVVLSRRLNGADGQFKGVVAMSMRPKTFTVFYPDSQLGAEGVVSVAGRDGVYRAWRAGNRPATTPDTPATRLLARVDANPVGTYIGESSIDGVERLVAYRALANYPLIVTVGRATHEVLAAFETERRNYVVIACIATAGLVAFFALVTQLLVGLGRSKAEIKAQQAFLLTLVDNIPLGVSVRDVRPAAYGKIILFNAANAKILGVPRDMALGHTFRNALDPRTAARIEESDRQMLIAPAMQELTESVAVDGRGVRQLHVVRAPVFHAADGGAAQVEYIISITSDVTDEQKRVEVARLAAKVFETTSDAIILSDPQDRAIMVNSAFSRMMGVKAEDVIGRPLGDSPFHGGAPAAYANQIERLRADGSFSAEVTIALEQREPLPCWLSASCVRDAEGNVVNYIRVLTDIAAIKASQQDLEVLAASLSDANTLLTTEMAERARAATELHDSNEKLRLINVKLREAQGQVVQSEKLASIGQLAAGVAHEINNPIGYVLSNFTTLEEYVRALFEMLAAYQAVETALPAARAIELDALRQKLELDFLKEDIPSLMTESREGISRVRKIVQDLKNFSRTDTTQDWAPADLQAGLDSTLNIVINEIKYKADIVKEYGDLPEVECLSSQINQVFMNLLVNAAQAIDKARGRIVIRTGVEGQLAWVEVADDGAGMTAEVKARVFDPFFTTKPVGKGTGLGLSLSYGIVQRHGGRIDLASEVGKGTTFRIWLPIKHAVAATPAAPDAPRTDEAEPMMSAVGD